MKKLVILCSSLGLAACGSGEAGNSGDGGSNSSSSSAVAVSSSSEGGEAGSFSFSSSDGEINMEAGPNSKVNLPAGFTLYPGAKVISTVTMGAGGQNTTTLSMTSPDDAEKLASFYRKQAETAGVLIASDVRANGNVMLAGESKGGLGFSLAAQPDGKGVTTVHLTLGQKNGG